MKHFLDLSAIDSLPAWLEEAVKLKKSPYQNADLGKHKTLGLLFFNPSLRTRLSTQKAAQSLGMQTMVMNVSGDAWTLEFEDGAVMNGTTSEHVKEAAAVISQYCDMIGVRAFPGLTDREKDASETVLNSFSKYAGVPVINMESATAHPLQALADALTIHEHTTQTKPKVVLSWAPHPRALPQAVANSFVEMMKLMKVDFSITHPEGYELKNTLTHNIPIEYNQEKAFAEADFIYVKNWSSYQQYGKVLHQDPEWRITPEKMKHTNNAYFMHCLPVRRNVVVTDAVLDGGRSLVIEQAANRTFAAQLVLKKLLENG